MARNGKSKPCIPCQGKLSPADKLQQTVETKSIVCFQSLEEIGHRVFIGVFRGANRGADSRSRKFGKNQISTESAATLLFQTSTGTLFE